MDRFRSLILLASLLVVALATVAYSGTPIILNHSGRLLGADETPVADGFHAMTFSIWTDSTGGLPIWTELQDVQTHNGLYSCNLGRLQPLGGAILTHGSSDLFVSVTISGVELLPRMRIGSAARAVVSSSVSSDVPNTGSVNMGVGADTTKMDASHATASGLIDSYVHLMDDRGLLGLRLYSPGQAHWGNARQEVSPTKITNYLDMDDDGDTVPDEIMEHAITPGTCSVAIKTKGTGADANRVIIVSPDSTLDSSSVGNSAGESVINNMRTRVDALESKLQAFGLLARSSSSTLSLSPTTCGVAIKTKGTGADNNRTSTVSGTTDDTSAVHVVSHDNNGDGTPEVALTEATSDKFAQVRGFKVEISGRQSSFESSCDSGKSAGKWYVDDDGDGWAERSVWQKVDNSDATIEASVDVNHDGTPDVGTTTQSSVDRSILKSFFERGDKPTSSQFQALIDSKSASTTTSVDNNHDGVPEGECKTASEQTRDYLYQKFQNGDIPTEDNIIADTVDPYSARTGLIVSNTGSWSSSSTACIIDSATHEVSVSYSPPGSLTPALMKAKEKANRTKCSNNLRTTNGSSSSESDISCDTAGNAQLQLSSATAGGTSSVIHVMTGDGSTIQLSRSSALSSSNASLSAGDASATLTLSDGSGTPKIVIDGQGRIGINELLPDAPIHHSSGARLTNAGDWVNASSRDLKENFTPVDGEQILEKIEQLPISEWNYKAESEDVKHIGPTAQDFKATFGVGANDKSISTIDPSGIALAAIKQLKKENNDLKQQVEELKKMVEELAKKK